MLRGPVGFEVAILGFHPSLPLRPCGFSVAVDTALESCGSIGLDPDRVSEIRPKRTSRGGHSLKHHRSPRLNDDR